MMTPLIPESAPFNAAQRGWLNGFLAGLFAEGSGAAPSTAEPPTPLTILFGSQTGTAEGLAKKIAKEAKSTGFEVKLSELDAFPFEEIPATPNLMVITSTYGEGEPPDNAQEFVSRITDASAPRMEGCRYSILGLGDTNYPDFNECAKRIDARLADLGAQRVGSPVFCDVDFEESAANWTSATLAAFKGGSAPVLNGIDQTESSTSAKPPAPSDESQSATLKTNRNLNATGSAKETRHIEIDLEDTGLVYEVGDALSVMPQNDPALVEEILAAAGFSGDEEASLSDGSTVPLYEALRLHCDISKLTPTFLEAATRLCRHPELIEVTGDKEKLRAFCDGRSILDPIADFRIAFPTAEYLLATLKPLRPRLYSIASSPRVHPGEVHLTVGVVQYRTFERNRSGVCSSFLARSQPGDPIQVKIHANPAFRIPSDGDLPLIMVGPGTGIAPFRAFLEERAATGAKGPNWLFFGDQKSACDFLYRDELEAMHRDGHLTRVDTAFSRDQEEKIYVQHRMKECGKELFAWLESGASFCVCGDASRMAKDVDRTLHEIVREQKGCNADEAAAYVAVLKKEKRYLRDVY